MAVVLAPFLPVAGGAIATGLSTGLKVAAGAIGATALLKAMQDARDVHWRNLGFPIPEIDLPKLPNPLELPETGILPFPTPSMGPVFDPRAGAPTAPEGRTPSTVYDFRPPAPLPGQTLPKTRRLTDAEIINDLIRQATTVNTGFNPLFPMPQWPMGFPFSFDPNEINSDWDWGGLNPISPRTLWDGLFPDVSPVRLRNWGYLDISTPGSYFVEVEYTVLSSFQSAGVSCSACECVDPDPYESSEFRFTRNFTVGEGVLKVFNKDQVATTQCVGCTVSCSPTPVGHPKNLTTNRFELIHTDKFGKETVYIPEKDTSGDEYDDFKRIGTYETAFLGLQVKVNGVPIELLTEIPEVPRVLPLPETPPITEVEQIAPAQLMAVPASFRRSMRTATKLVPVITLNTATDEINTTLETETEPEMLKPDFPKIAPPVVAPRPVPGPTPVPEKDKPKDVPAIPPPILPQIAPKPKEGESDDAKEVTPKGPIVKNPPTIKPATTPASSIKVGDRLLPAKTPNPADFANELGRLESKMEASLKDTGGIKWDDILLGLEGLALLLDQLLGEKMPAQEYKLTGVCEETDEEGNQPEKVIEVEEMDKLDGIYEGFKAMNQLLQQHLEWKTPTCDAKVDTPKPEGQLVTTRWRSFEPSPVSGDRLRKLFRFRLKANKSLEQVTAHWKDFTWESGVYIVKANGPWGQCQVWAKDEKEGRRVIMHALTHGGWLEKEEEAEWQIDEAKSSRYGIEATFGVDGSVNRPWITMREGPSGPPEGIEY